MKAISVRRPWSAAIAHLGKDVENRPRAWHYRGPIAIHASNGFDQAGLVAIARLRRAQRTAEERERIDAIPIPTGVVAMAELIGCHLSTRVPLTDPEVDPPTYRQCCLSPWAEFVDDDRPIFHLVLANVRPLPIPIPCRGALGLWNVPEAVERLVDVQLCEVARDDC